MKTAKVLTTALMLSGATAAQAAPITFDLRGDEGASFVDLPSSFALTQSGLTATFDARTFTRTRLDRSGVITQGSTLQDARIGRFQDGVGVFNSAGDNSVTIDGRGFDDFVQITFSSVVDIIAVTFGAVDRNDDFRLLTDTSGDATLGQGDLVSQQFDVPANDPFTGFDGLQTDILGIGAFGRNDDFTLRSITVNFEPAAPDLGVVPLPAAGWMMLAAFGAIGALRRSRKA